MNNLTPSQKEELKNMADALIETLGSMSPEEADKVVAKVAATIMCDWLGIEGRLIKTTDFFVCSKRLATSQIGGEVAGYKWVPDKP